MKRGDAYSGMSLRLRPGGQHVTVIEALDTQMMCATTSKEVHYLFYKDEGTTYDGAQRSKQGKS